MSKLINKVSITVVSLATVLSLSGVASLVPATAHGATVEELQAQIAYLLGQIQALQGQLTTSGTVSTGSSTVPASLLSSSDLTVGSKGAVVKDLQRFLNGAGYVVSASGAGSVGMESEYFGNATKAALAKFQAAQGISPAAGYFGAKTRAKLQSMSVAVGGTTPVGTGTTPTVPMTGAGSMVSLATDNPAATTVVSDTADGAQAFIPMLKFNVVASASAGVQVNSVVVTRGGISADTDISNVYLYEGDTQIASNPTIASGKITFSKSSGLFSVPAGMSKAITVKLDLKNNVSSGKTMTLSIASASDVVLASGTIAGSFPMSGNAMTTASITDLGKLVFSNVSPAANGTVDPGTTSFEIWRFQAANTDQDTELRKIKFTIVGSVNVGDLKNFTLWDGATQIGSAVADMSSEKTVEFAFTTPFVVSKGITKTLSLKADVVAGTNRSFRASLQNSADVMTFDKGYSVFLKTNGTDSFSIIEPNTAGTAVNYSINVGTLTQTLSSASPTGNIPDGATNVLLAKFSWKANGEDVKVSSLSASSTASNVARTLKNVRLLVDGSQVGTTIASMTADGSANTGFGTFGNSFIIRAGQTASVEVKADLTDTNVAANDTFVVGVSAGTSNAQGVTSLSSISTVAQNASTLTVKSGTVTVAKNSAFGDKSATNPTGTVNASSAKIASFIITAGSGESVDLSQISVKDDNAGTCIGTYIQNLTLKNASGVQLGTTYANPSSSCATANTYTFNISPSVNVANGAQYVVDIYGDLKASYAGAASLIEVDSVTATGHDTGTSASASSQALSTQAVYVAGSGNYMISVDPDSPVVLKLSPVLMGATNQMLAKFKVTASTTENINISQIVLSNNVSSAATGSLQNIKLYELESGNQIGSTVPSFDTTSATSTFVHAVFSSLNWTVPKGTSKTIVVQADVTTFEAGSYTTTGQTNVISFLKYYTGTSGSFTATGASSGISVTPSFVTNVAWSGLGNNNAQVGAATSTLYRAKLSTAWASDTPSGLTSGSATQTIGKFVIANAANAGSYSATVKKIDLDLSTTISVAAGATRTLSIYKDSVSGTALGTTTFGHGSLQNFTSTNITEGNFTDVEISSGASKTFYAVLDTSDASANKTLSVTVGSGDVTWTDGITASITSMTEDLPLTTKTLSY